MPRTPHQILKAVWGYDQFRGNQGEIVEALCQQKDALIVMPTGGGKSICFQVPGLVLPGVSIVISPLIALMENQVQALKAKRVPAALLHSQLDRTERKQILSHLSAGKLKLLYLSPETLLSDPVMSRLLDPNLRISSLILDEAHCLVQWGDSFRPVYLELGAVRDRLLAAKSHKTPINIAAFTATANPIEQATIEHSLGLQNPTHFVEVPYRSNLYLAKQRVWTPADRRGKLLKFIRSQGKTSGIVYVRTRQDSEDLAQWLRTEKISAGAYHAGLLTREKRQIESDWMGNSLACVVATSAFGMGVDKPDVRWVVQYQPPFWLSEYVQEIGRAGRDGKRAEGLTLVSEPTGFIDAIDSQTWNNTQRQFKKQLGTRSTADLVKVIPKKPEVQQYLNHRGCRWTYIQTFFGAQDESQSGCGHCDRCSKKIGP
jgi:ATP-dependent DNA helicase RecQ